MMTDTPDDQEKAALAKVEEVARKAVSDVLGKLFDSGEYDVEDDSGKRTPAPRRSRRRDDEDDTPSRSTIRGEVQAAIRAAKEKDEQQSKEQKLNDRIRELEQSRERQPRQHRPITQKLWGYSDGAGE
jgi:hypothetical protein